MGCLVFIIECIFQEIFDGIFFAMQWIVPDKGIGRYTWIILKIIVGIFTLILFLSVFLGVLALVSDDPFTKQIGKYMVFVPLGILAVQILLGIVVRIRAKKK